MIDLEPKKNQILQFNSSVTDEPFIYIITKVEDEYFYGLRIFPSNQSIFTIFMFNTYIEKVYQRQWTLIG